MKKLLTLAAAGLLGIGAYAQSDAAIDASVFVAEDRAGWIISGCSEENYNEIEGGFAQIKDGNVGSYWHSTWSASTAYETACPHYFLIDRGASAASSPIDGFGYLPRQGEGNGHVIAYRLYILDNIDGLNTVTGGTRGAHVDDNHASLTTFLNGKTPVKEGTFDIVHDQVATRGLRQVTLDETQRGRYVLFVIDGTSSNAGANLHANCAEFYLYKKEQGTVLNFKRSDGSLAVSCVTSLLPVGTEITCPAEIGSGSGTVAKGATIEFTLKDGVTPFKLVSARRQYLWAKANAQGMGTALVTNNFDEGSWFLEVPQEDGTIKIFSIDKFKFHQSTTVNLSGSSIPYATDDSGAGTFSIVRDDSGAEIIRTSTADDGGFNIQGNEGRYVVSYWTQSDIGSLWFMVYDKDAFATNKQSYSTEAELERIPDSPFKQAYTDAKTKYEEISGISLATDEFFAARSALKAAIDKAATARFGKTGVNIPALIEELNSKTTAAGNFSQEDMNVWKIIKNADTFAAMDIASTDAVDIWNAYKTTIKSSGNTQEDIDAITTAYAALVDGSANTPGGAHIKFSSNKVPGDFMLMRLHNNAYQVGRYSNDVNGNKTTWTLKSAEGGFRLYNEYASMYAGFPTADNTPTAPVASESDAPIFVFDLYDAATARYGVKCLGAPSNRCYFHTNGDNNIVRYQKGDNSSWYLHASDETTANNEANIGADDNLNDARANFLRTPGDGLGEYTITADPEGAYASAYEQYTALADEPTNAEKHAVADALRAACLGMTCTLNMPKVGTYLTFRGANNENVALFYTTGTYNHNGNHKTILDKTNADYSDAAAIMYYDGEHLLSYTTGYYLGLSSGGWPTFIGEDDMATNGRGNTPVTLGIAPGSHASLYQINYARNNGAANCGLHINTATENGVTYLFGDRCGNDDNTGLEYTRNEDAHNWVISQVNELPVAIHADGYGSFIAPVAVRFSAGNHAYVGSVNGSVLTFAEVEAGTDIAPNTPVIIKGTASSTVNATINYDYVAPATPAALATEESTIRLGGSHIAKKQVAETDLSTFAKAGVDATPTDDNNVTLNKVTEGSVIPVNTLLLTLHNDSKLIAEGGETATVNLVNENSTVGISAIEFRNLDGTREIYDLQGRRVQRASKGLYIINGVKTLVK